MAGRLTTTSYCLLGLLRLRPFSAYELTKYMRRSALSRLWPRTEAALYREGRRLVDLGLVNASTAHEGGRARTVFEINAKGQKAFAAWLVEPGEPLSFECEAAVKAFFADAADLDSLRLQLEQIRESTDRFAAAVGPATDDWLAGHLEFPDRIHYTAMAADLIDRITVVADDWAADWLAKIDSWEGTAPDPINAEHARIAIEAVQRSIEHRSHGAGRRATRQKPAV